MSARLDLGHILRGVQDAEPELAAELTLDRLEGMIRQGLEAVAKDEGDPPPIFTRDGDYLKVTTPVSRRRARPEEREGLRIGPARRRGGV